MGLNQLERQLKAVRKQLAKYESREYDLLCQFYKLEGRCYRCEYGGKRPGECDCVGVRQ
jgi:hypothetical protein